MHNSFPNPGDSITLVRGNKLIESSVKDSDKEKMEKVEISQKREVKFFLLGLILSKVLTSIIVARFAAYSNDALDFWQVFIILIFSGTGAGFLAQLGLFIGYFFIVKYLVKHVKLEPFFYLALLIAAVLCCSLVTFIDWEVSKASYSNFGDYIYKGNYYIVYMIVVALFLNIFGVRSRDS